MEHLSYLSPPPTSRLGKGAKFRVRISRENAIAAIAVAGIAAYLGLRHGAGVTPARADIALWLVLAVGGIPILGAGAARLGAGVCGVRLSRPA
jgi:hypothetical protein